tara:strand:+ start:152 stop:1447 length:1296 start_codon:yes stop_codon:yes gene_type:complete
LIEDIEDIRNARYISLYSPPTTEQAKNFTKVVIETIKATEQRQRRRKANDERAFQETVGRIVGDLLIGYEQEANQWSFHEMYPAAFSDLSVGYKLFRSTVETLSNARLVVVAKGRNHKPFEFEEGVSTFINGLATRFQPTSTLIDLASVYDISKGSYQDHFVTQLPRKVIEVRQSKKEGEGSGRKMKPKQTKRFLEIEEQLKTINEFTSTFTFEGMRFSGFRRLFNEGDRLDFDYNHGGRLYHADGQGYIGMSKEKRSQIKIDGESVVEIDINASYLTIMHGLKQQPLPIREDIYAIGGLPREVVKKWFAISFGIKKFHRQWLKGNVKDLKENCPDYRTWMTAKVVEKEVLEYFPFMADWSSGDIGWSNLMFIESEIIIGTMLELMNDHKLPSLPVHDCIIVRKSDQELAMRILSEHFHKQTGLVPKLKIK